METYPIFLTGMQHRKCVVIGGGRVATRKVRGLLAAGTCVTVVSPHMMPQLVAWGRAGQIAVIERHYCDSDLDGALLVVAATDDPDTNQAVLQAAHQRGCLVNVVDDPAHCDFFVPAVLRRGEVTVAVSTGGASPALASHLRQRLDAVIGPEYGDLAALLSDLRPDLVAGRRQPAAVLRLLESDILDVLRREGKEAARAYALAVLAEFNATRDSHSPS